MIVKVHMTRYEITDPPPELSPRPAGEAGHCVSKVQPRTPPTTVDGTDDLKLIVERP